MTERSVTTRVVERLVKALPGRAAARVDLARKSVLQGWDVPFNGQAARQLLVRKILETGVFDRIIETGTFRGATTAYLAHVSGLPVDSVELSSRFGGFAAAMLSPTASVTLHEADSRTYLSEVAKTTMTHASTFFYLDAHWNADVPRSAELEIILERWTKAVIMIDDFKVDDDPGYGFANYNGRALDLSYLPSLQGWNAYYPSTRSTADTGARRGCLVIASPSFTSEINGISLLRRA